MTTNIDQQVLDLFNLVRTKQSEISKSERPKWTTTCVFSYSPDDTNAGSRVNIQTVTDISKLTDILGFLIQKFEYYNKALEAIGNTKINIGNFSWMGFSIDDWKSDIISRINQISVKAKKKELDTLSDRLNAIVSPEQRREMELEAIKKELSL